MSVTNKIERRASHLQQTAQEFAALMEKNEALGQLIGEAVDNDGDEESMATVIEAAQEFQRFAAQIVGHIAIITAEIDNSSAAVFLGGLAGTLVEIEMEHDPLLLLRGLLGGQ